MRNTIEIHQLKALQTFGYQHEQLLASTYDTDDAARNIELEQVLLRAGASVFTDASGDRIAEALQSLPSWGHEPVPAPDDAIDVQERTLTTPYSASEIEHVRVALDAIAQREGIRAAILRGEFGLAWDDIAADGGVSVRTVRSKARKATNEFTKEITGRAKLAGCGDHNPALPKAIYGQYADGATKDLNEVQTFFDHADSCQACHDEYVTVRRAFEAAAAFMPPREGAGITSPIAPQATIVPPEVPLDLDEVLVAGAIADPVVEVFAPAPVPVASESEADIGLEDEPVAAIAPEPAPEQEPVVEPEPEVGAPSAPSYDGSSEAPYDWFTADEPIGTDAATFEDFEVRVPDAAPEEPRIDFAAAAALQAGVLEAAEQEPTHFSPIPTAEAPAIEPVSPQDEYESASEAVAPAAAAESDAVSDSIGRFATRDFDGTSDTDAINEEFRADADFVRPRSVLENPVAATTTLSGRASERVGNASSTGRFGSGDVAFVDDETKGERRARRTALVLIAALLVALAFVASDFLPGEKPNGTLADRPTPAAPAKPKAKKAKRKVKRDRPKKSSPKPQYVPTPQPVYAAPAPAPVQKAPAAPASSVGDGSSEFLPEERG